MENKVVNLQVKDNLDETTKSVGSLKSQLRQAQNEVTALSDKFGATSKEAIEAAKRAGELKDKIGDAKALTEAFNPDAKFKSLSASLTGVAGGFSVVTGAMGAFGSNSKAVEEQLLKVQSAMAIASGLQAVGESIDSFKHLGAVVKSYSIVQKVITAGQWLWNAAMTANPLGAIVLAITAVIAAGYGLIKFFGDVATTSKSAMIGIKANTQALLDSERITKKHNEALKDSSDYHLAMAKASGKSADEIRKLAITEINADISLKALNRTIAQNTYYRELNSLATLKASGATAEAIKMQDELVKKSLENFSNENKALTESLHNKKLLIQKNNVEVRQEETDHITKVNSDAKTAKEKKEEEVKVEAKRLKEEKDKAIISEAEAYRNQLEVVEKVEADAKKANADALLTEQQLAIQNENLAYQAKIDNAIKFGTSKEEIETQHLNALNDINLTAQNKKYEDDKLAAEKQIAIEQALAEAKLTLQNKQLDNVTAGIGVLKGVFEKNKAIQKGLLIAENAAGIAKIIINTMAGNAKTIGTMGLPAAAPFVVANNISAGISVAASIAATAKGLSALGGGSAGGGGNIPNGGTGGGSPQFNVIGASGQNQIAQSIGNQNQQPIKTFVVANEVTTGQALNRNIISNASMG